MHDANFYNLMFCSITSVVGMEGLGVIFNQRPGQQNWNQTCFVEI